jgi:hypothetical protein
MMKKIVIILLVVIPSITPLYADTWCCPPVVNYCSENKLFIARVTAAEKDNGPFVEVYHTEVSIDTFLWKAALGNDYSPQKAFVSNKGEYVVTINECSGRVHGGFGDYVIAFYNKEGLIKNYSLEQILHYPDKIDKKEFRRLTHRTVSGRSWAHRPMFFDEQNGEEYFCVWLFYGKRWLAWQVKDGKEIKITEKMIQRWNEQARLWAREVGINTRHYRSAADFLGMLKNPEDRKVIESLLTDTAFYTRPVNKWKGEFIRYNASSPKRALAESILAQWDGKPKDIYYYLGTVEGTLKLHAPPKAGDRWLCIYLLPGEVIKDNWYAEVPVHRITAYFWEYSFHNEKWPTSNIPFRIHGVTPGKYRVKAVWDKAQPYNFQDNYIKGPPQEGDYQSLDSTVITVEAGKTVDNLTIDCTHKVTDSVN